MNDRAGNGKGMSQQAFGKRRVIFRQRCLTAVLPVRTPPSQGLGAGNRKTILRPAFCNNKKSPTRLAQSGNHRRRQEIA